MTHRVHPYIFRIGRTGAWRSRWLQPRRFVAYLREDLLLRTWLMKRLRATHLKDIEIERFPNILHITIKTARPGILIGRGGEGVERLKAAIYAQLAKVNKRFGMRTTMREMKLTIEEVRIPESHAAIAAQMIAEELEKRVSFRRVLRQYIEKISSAKGVQGAKISLKGRLDGAEMARYEWLKRGRVPLQTIRADIDYAEKTAYTTYGTIGVKVWIYKGDVFSEVRDRV
ncbi:MAG: 30S ribosomal protein S3 [Parcubacteria group bacterium Gr01-1014_66]|nr:MAG: 30S ribosomal protein S3 [Parcubacteria group bacterium Gr01-1014_66]